jgi:hypothetical protein
MPCSDFLLGVCGQVIVLHIVAAILDELAKGRSLGATRLSGKASSLLATSGARQTDVAMFKPPGT